LQGFTQIDQQVPAVDHLTGLRSTFARTTGIVAGAITNNGVDAGMLAQPRCEGLGGAIGKQIDRSSLR
jgi:hypothetical protein